ncbi:LysM peptidoglycan-binding domain-containing protein [Nocardioides sp. Bht2]|uniref:LysM peptidoglycan-binding domain-containing protein n=1 Tax=Nocardioides sp. Bht2 TaxID=3392297 RepID=UPI0039B37806
MSTITVAGPRIAASRPTLRLTRRGRIVVFVAACLMVMAAALVLGTSSVATNSAGGTPTQTEMIRVDHGQTLWAIAAEIADDGEVREMVQTIKQLNALDSSALQAGQTLHIPVQ